MRFVPKSSLSSLSSLKTASLKMAPLMVGLAVGLSAGCVTRTVYVVDDSPREARVAVAQEAAPAAAAPLPAPVEDTAGIAAVDDFYEPLTPYGRWVSYPGYGMVFQPSVTVVGTSFRPYTHGHWERTEYGWTWVDHHPFGWATGHYGRWFYDAGYGWVWVPGTVWSPAWVTWRTGGGYVGWAAMPPGAYYGSAYSVYDSSWCFVSYSRFGSPYVGTVLVVGPSYRTVYVSTYPSRETVVVYGREQYRGPDVNEVQRSGGRVVHRPLREVDEERAVSRPPAGTNIPRDRQRSRTSTDGSASDGRVRDRDGNDRGNDPGNDPGNDRGDRAEARSDPRDHNPNDRSDDRPRPIPLSGGSPEDLRDRADIDKDPRKAIPPASVIPERGPRPIEPQEDARDLRDRGIGPSAVPSTPIEQPRAITPERMPERLPENVRDRQPMERQPQPIERQPSVDRGVDRGPAMNVPRAPAPEMHRTVTPPPQRRAPERAPVMAPSGPQRAPVMQQPPGAPQGVEQAPQQPQQTPAKKATKKKPVKKR